MHFFEHSWLTHSLLTSFGAYCEVTMNIPKKSLICSNTVVTGCLEKVNVRELNGGQVVSIANVVQQNKEGER